MILIARNCFSKQKCGINDDFAKGSEDDIKDTTVQLQRRKY